ncbi:anti-dorsalizing morphogenic protein precursor [Silurus asotus]|uniref:Anti-dorsalizing morphogenic protein n=1 Tax=Silurus asotus TaxID=30991 RepID=A0AAD5A5L9_SILAS|nr:anti-dorsalizing morphogenic protein precursor [Silurus asotus]
MTVLRYLYLSGLFVLQLVSLSTLMPADVSEAPDASVITDVSTRNDPLQVRDVRRPAARKKAPGFMLEMYEENIRHPETVPGNIVRSLQAQSNGAFYFFNLTSFNPWEKITKAEFRWFRRAHEVSPGHHFYRVDLYEVLDSRVKPWRGNLIISRVLPVYTEGWEVFNITQTSHNIQRHIHAPVMVFSHMYYKVTKWILSSSTNNGIMLVSTSTSGHWLETTVQSARETTFEENEVYLVIYSNDGRRSSGEGVSTGGQNLAFSLEFLKYKSSLQAAVRKRRSRHKRAAENIYCQRTPLYVDFAKLGWSGWIISPRGYNANHCTGSCPFPLSGNLHATNHAIVQSIVNTLKLSNKVGRPCCVPDKLQPISLLYFDDEENVVLKQYDDMVAGSCGCH